MSPSPRSLVLLMFFVLEGTAGAQPGVTPSLPADARDDKSPAVALGLSLLGTGAGVAALFAASHVDDGEMVGALGVAALVVGPSLGHLYAGEPGRAVRHAGVRLGALAIMGAGLAMVLSSPCAFGSENECPEIREDAGVGLFLAGAFLGAGSAAYSVIDAPLAAARTNRAASSLVLAPAPVLGPDRSTAFGLVLTGTL